MNRAIPFEPHWARLILLVLLLTTASSAWAWNEDTHQNVVQLSYQVINVVDYEKNRRADPTDPTTAVFPEILEQPEGVSETEWEDFLDVVGESRTRLGELVIGAEREELDEHSGNILCAPPVARRLKTIDEYPYGLIATSAKKFNEDPNAEPPCQKLEASEYRFGGIYDDPLLALDSGDGAHTGSMLGWLSAGVDSRIDDWVPVVIPLEAALNFISALLNGGDPDSPLADAAAGLLLVLLLVVALAILSLGITPLGAAAVLVASFFEYDVTSFGVAGPRDFPGLGHFINVQEPVSFPAFPAFPGLPTQIPSNRYDDHQGKDLEQAYLLRGPNLANAVQDSFDHYVLDKGGLGATIEYDDSFGPRRYQITDPDDGSPGSVPFRGEDYWEDNDLSESTFTPVDNLGYYGWRKWRDDACKKVETLHWPLHAIGDASAPHHVVGATGLGHRPFEDIVQFSGAGPSPPGPEGFSGQWDEIIHGQDPAAGREQARRIVVQAFEWSRFIRNFQETHAGDIPVREIVTRLAQRTLGLIHAADAPKISCTPNACRLVTPPREPGDIRAPTGSTIECTGTCSGIDVRPSCEVLFGSEANRCSVNEYIALELSTVSGEMPAIFPPGLSHYYDGAFTNEGRAYYRTDVLVDEQRKYIELGTAATLAFLAHAAELVSTPVSEEDCLCDDPLVRCSGVCRDLNTDSQNCGFCGLSCGTGERCCEGRCVDVTENESNCGRCGRTCNVPVEQCLSGICSCPNPGLSACPDLCTNIQTDPSNCGWCGHRCAPGEPCIAGRCGFIPGPD